ncbi:MAG: hypothetical protein KTR28_03050 [Micavibrio sp.]|nr:hypothetical protein [Micavibrio sp.]
MKKAIVQARKFGMTNDNSIVAGSTVLYWTGLFTPTNDDKPDDLDIILMDPEKFDRLKSTWGTHAPKLNPKDRVVKIEKPGFDADLEISIKWPLTIVTLREIWENSTIHQGVRIMHPVDVIYSMRQFNRPKDQQRLERLEQNGFS